MISTLILLFDKLINLGEKDKKKESQTYEHNVLPSMDCQGEII
jgi:hypothetical protein